MVTEKEYMVYCLKNCRGHNPSEFTELDHLHQGGMKNDCV